MHARSLSHADDLSNLRRYLLRAVYFLNFALLGLDVWPQVLRGAPGSSPVESIATSWWATLSLLSVLGLRYPVKMLPLLLAQFTYKVVWLAAFALPQWSTLSDNSLTRAMLIGLVIDLIVIPWFYVWRHFLREPAERWR